MNNNKSNYIIFFVLSFIIILGYSYLFPPPKPKQAEPLQTPTGEVQKDNFSTTTPPANIKGFEQNNIFSKRSNVIDPFKISKDLIAVKSKLYNGTIDPLGARVVEWNLYNYNETTDDDTVKYNLIKDSPPSFNLHVEIDTINVPNPIPFSYSGDMDITLTDSPVELEFNWQSAAEGIIISKTYTLDPSSYLIASTLKIENKTDKSVNQQVVVDAYSKSLKTGGQRKTKEFVVLVSEEIKKEADSPEEKKQYDGKIGWFGFLDKYFLYTFLPETGAASKVEFYSLSEQDLVRAVYSYPKESISPNNEKPYKSKLYLGPLELNILKKASPELGSAMNFGWFDFLAKPVLSLLNYLNKYFNNYGISIIVITILIRLVFLPLTIKSMASMKKVQIKMQEIKPKIEALKEKYKDDKAMQNSELMKLYSAHGVNPLSSLGGCLPMLIQIPVFIALYEVLLNSIDLRHSHFLWIKDLSAPEMLFDIPVIGIPFRILPLAMGVSWFISQKMTPMTTPGSEQMELQMKMMQFMPIIFTVMFWSLPSGLVLYWTVSNILSVAQQLYVNRKVVTH